MKLAKASANLVTVLAVALCFATAAAAQDKPAQKPKHGAKAAGERHPSAAVAVKPGAPAGAKPEAAGNKRDPFAALVSEHKASAAHSNLPPGKGGLVISTVRVDGTVRSGDAMIAVLSNPDQHVYFVHEGDQLYDGDVQKIGLDGVTFKEDSKDAFGKPVERVVTKRIYASAGEQQ